MKQRRSHLEILWDLNNRVEQAQSTLADYLPPDTRISSKGAISNVLAVLDDRELLKIQDEARGCSASGQRSSRPSSAAVALFELR